MFQNDSCAECFDMKLVFLRSVADVQFRVKSTISKRGNFCRLQEEYIKCCRVDISYISRRFSLCSPFLLPFGMRSVTLFNHMSYINAPHRTVLEVFLHTALRKRIPYATSNEYVR